MGLLSSITSLVGGISKKNAAKRAARQQEEALNKAMALQREMYDKQMGLQEPFRAAGLTAQNELMRQLGLGGDAASAGYGNLMQDFGAAQFEADPGYAFRLSEGLKAMERGAAARGGLISGAALKAGQQYGQEMGSQEYQNAFKRYQDQRMGRYNMLADQQGIGIGATNRQGAATGAFGDIGSDIYQGVGNVKAAGTMGGSNALWGGIGNFAGAMDQYGSGMRGSAYGGAGRGGVAGMSGDQLGNYLNTYYGTGR